MPLPPPIAQAVAAARTQVRMARTVTAAGRLLAWLCGALAIAFLADWLVIARIGEGGWGDRLARAILDLAVLGLAALRVRRGVAAELRRLWGDDEVALLIEERHPGLGGRLVSAVQFVRAVDVGAPLDSPDLTAAAIERGGELAGGVVPGRVVDRPQRKQALLAGAGALAALALAIAIWPAHAKACARRLLLGDAAYPTATRILALRVPAIAARGEPLAFEVDVDPAGSVPGEAAVEIDSRDRRFSVRLLPPAAAATAGAAITFRGVLPQPLADLRCRALAGDARSPSWVPVRVTGRPVVTGIKATLDYPAYLQLRPVTVELADLRVPEGTRIALLAGFSQPVRMAQVRRSEGLEILAPQAMAIDAAATSASASLAGLRSGRLSVVCEDRDGLACPEPVEHNLTVDPDRPPSVTLTFPGGDRSVTRVARWPLRFTCADDHGFSAARVRFAIERPGQDKPIERSVDLAVPAGRGGPAEGLLDGPALGLADGDRVQAWVEVVDNRRPDPQTAASRRIAFAVVDLASLQERYRTERDQALEQVRELPGRQREVGTAIQQLQEKSK